MKPKEEKRVSGIQECNMLFREDLELREINNLSDFAMKSKFTKGRAKLEEPCEIRTEYQRDRDRILHSKSFRRLMHKTQVFLSPEGDHFRTRLTHTLEVAQIARTIARALNLNEDLTEAIAMGHDLGHTPFGHNGEDILDKIHPAGFKHNEQSLRVCDILEYTQSRIGMNLTYEVRDGIANHTGPNLPTTLEGQVVRISDRIAYINHDIDDAIRSGVILPEELPTTSIKLFGDSHRKRINNMVMDIINQSEGKDRIYQSPEFKEELDALRSFMFLNVYRSTNVKKEEDLNKVEVVISSLYNYYVKNPELLPEYLHKIVEKDGVKEASKDFVAGMTDRFALAKYTEIFVPKAWGI